MVRILIVSLSLLLTEGFAIIVFYAAIIISALISNFFIKTPGDDFGAGLFFVFLWMAIGFISVIVLVPLFYSFISSFLLNRFTKIKISLLKSVITPYSLLIPAIIAAIIQGQVWDKIFPGLENIIYILTFITFNSFAIPLALYFTKILEEQR